MKLIKVKTRITLILPVFKCDSIVKHQTCFGITCHIVNFMSLKKYKSFYINISEFEE